MTTNSFSHTKIIKLLHILSHFRWIFMLWIMGLLFYGFFINPDKLIQITGTMIFLSGILMCFASLSDISKSSDKEIKKFSNPQFVKRQIKMLFFGVITLFIISILFFSVPLLFPAADASFKKDFTKLGYDCLVMILGFLCLIKQTIEQAIFAKTISNN